LEPIESESEIETEIDPVRRARLIAKGRILYGKYCGTDGRGICAESFALHHIRLGEPIVARDLLDFLEATIDNLSMNDPDGRLAMTEALAVRVRRQLEREAGR
jgi:hypothetical protein